MLQKVGSRNNPVHFTYNARAAAVAIAPRARPGLVPRLSRGEESPNCMGAVVANGDAEQSDGKCHRKQTAWGFSICDLQFAIVQVDAT
jgi:hypothetical protein